MDKDEILALFRNRLSDFNKRHIHLKTELEKLKEEGFPLEKIPESNAVLAKELLEKANRLVASGSALFEHGDKLTPKELTDSNRKMKWAIDTQTTLLLAKKA